MKIAGPFKTGNSPSCSPPQHESSPSLARSTPKRFIFHCISPCSLLSLPPMMIFSPEIHAKTLYYANQNGIRGTEELMLNWKNEKDQILNIHLARACFRSQWHLCSQRNCLICLSNYCQLVWTNHQCARNQPKVDIEKEYYYGNLALDWKTLSWSSKHFSVQLAIFNLLSHTK